MVSISTLWSNQTRFLGCVSFLQLGLLKSHNKKQSPKLDTFPEESWECVLNPWKTTVFLMASKMSKFKSELIREEGGSQRLSLLSTPLIISSLCLSSLVLISSGGQIIELGICSLHTNFWLTHRWEEAHRHTYSVSRFLSLFHCINHTQMSSSCWHKRIIQTSVISKTLTLQKVYIE